jgi:hypothetical protein
MDAECCRVMSNVNPGLDMIAMCWILLLVSSFKLTPDYLTAFDSFDYFYFAWRSNHYKEVA